MLVKRLKELRARDKISQAALADKLGVSQQAVAKWETEKATPDPDMITKIAGIFKVTTDYLLGLTDNPGVILMSSVNKDKKMPKDLLKILEQEDYTLNGRLASPEDKARIQAIVEAIYWDAKERNRRKK